MTCTWCMVKGEGSMQVRWTGNIGHSRHYMGQHRIPPAFYGIQKHLLRKNIICKWDTHNVNILTGDKKDICSMSHKLMLYPEELWEKFDRNEQIIFLHIRGRGSQYQNLTSSICSSVHLFIIQLFVCHFTWLFSCQFVCLFIPQLEHPLFHSLGFLFDLFSCASFFVYLCPYVSIGLHISI